MKQKSLIVAAIAMIPFAVAVAQTPPMPPATPAVPVKPAPVVISSPMPGEPIYIDREAIRRAVDDAKWQGQLAADEARRALEDTKWQMKGKTVTLVISPSNVLYKPDTVKFIRSSANTLRAFVDDNQ